MVSPHLDDGVLSLGAAMASWARRGSHVELLTVLACDPDSDAPAGGWDRRAGHSTEGESARARREEDRRACEHLGASPRWLPFGSVDYERHGTDDEVRDAVAARADRADALLVPAFPLSHPDHAWLARVLAGGRYGCCRLGLYAEEPYTRRGSDPTIPGWIMEILEEEVDFNPVSAALRDRLAKWRAIREYGSQLPLLGMARSLRRGPLAVALAREAVAWSSDPGRRPH